MRFVLLQPLTKVVFVNYEGPQSRIDSLAEIKGIGASLGAEARRAGLAPARFGGGARYRVVRAVDPKAAEGLEADLLPRADIELTVIPRVPFPRRPNAAALRFPGSFKAAVSAAACDVSAPTRAPTGRIGGRAERGRSARARSSSDQSARAASHNSRETALAGSVARSPVSCQAR